jgi:NMD protein affecting ribosome stability and mRNA decay
MEKEKMKLARPNYFQGVLQLRDVTIDVLDFVKKLIDKRHDAVVSKTVEYKNGIDLYLSSQKYIRVIGKKLKENYGGEVIISSKLHTRNKQGKELYRINLMFRLPNHKVGEVVIVRGSKIKIISIGRKIFGKDMDTGKKVTIRSKDLARS